MSTLVLLEGQVKSGRIADIKVSMAQLFPDMRSYDGCQEIDEYFNVGDPRNVVMVEQWETRSHHEKYIQ